MVDIVRRKNADFVSPDVSSSGKAKAKMTETIGGAVAGVVGLVGKAQVTSFKDKLSQLEDVQRAEKKAYDTQKKAFDASDKLVASDMAGRLKNDLLRWNLAQRENNPSYIGTREHESAMRAEYDRLAKKYNVGLGEVGMADFQEKTQGYVNTFLDNDIKWAYQQKIKQGEESAKASAQQIEQTAALHGANGDVQGAKDAYAEMSAPLKEYIKTASPENAPLAMAELARRSATAEVMGLAENDPVLANEMLNDLEKFNELVSPEMLHDTAEAIIGSERQSVLNKLADVEEKKASVKKGSPAYRDLEKNKKQLEKDLKNYDDYVKVIESGSGQITADSEYGKKALESLQDSVKQSVKPIVEKAAGERVLEQKQQAIAERVDRFGNFLTLPTPDKLKWFEEENQMSYVQEEKNMSELPEEFKTKAQRNTELIKNMMKYKENFGDVSLVEISDAKGTKKMFEDLKATAQTDADKDGNIDNVLLKAIIGCNNAHQSEIAQKDFDAYVNLQNRIVYDRTFKKQIQDFIANTKDYMPDKFWTAPRLAGSMSTRIDEEMEGRTRDVLLSVLHEWQKGEMSGEDITKMYIQGLEKAYNDTVSDFFGFNMGQVVKQYEEKGMAIANINGVDYFYKGVDANGNPKWEEVSFSTAKKQLDNATKSGKTQVWSLL